MGSCASPATWRVPSDADGWRYQLHGAEVKRGVTRRALMAASPLFCLSGGAGDGAGRRHGGRRPQPRRQPDPDGLWSRQLRAGGRADAPRRCVGDLSRRRFRSRRSSRPWTAACGQAAIHGRASSTTTRSGRSSRSMRWQAHSNCRCSGRRRISTATRASRPSIIVSSEGADFLEGRIERLDEAYQRWGLRHLQLDALPA